MTKINTKMMADMHARRLAGETPEIIAAAHGLKIMTVYQHLRRTYGLSARLPGPANDNNSNRTTHMAARNGGCSTLSGLMPVSLPRVVTAANDNDADLQAGLAVNEYGLAAVAAWVTHVYVCIQASAWILLAFGCIVAPVGIIHGFGVWLGAF